MIEREGVFEIVRYSEKEREQESDRKTGGESGAKKRNTTRH